MLRVPRAQLASLLDAVFPPRCRLCGASAEDDFACAGHALPLGLDGPRCDRCASPLPPALPDATRCAACRRRRPRFRRVVALGEYGGALREWILALKHGGRDELARPLGLRLGEELRGAERELHGDPRPLLVPVPLHPLRRIERGYDQALKLARAAAEAGGGELARLLARTRATAPQGESGPRTRRSNVAGAFALRGGQERARLRRRVEGRSLWLVDDVMTSGATADACARALGGLGARSCSVLVVARASGAAGDATGPSRPP